MRLMREPRLSMVFLTLLIPAMVVAQQTDEARPGNKPVRSYSTRFQHDEDPISEGGKWINGGKDGIDWYNVITKNGFAHGEVSHGGRTRSSRSEEHTSELQSQSN